MALKTSDMLVSTPDSSAKLQFTAPRPPPVSRPVAASTARAMTPTHAGSTWCSGCELKPTSKNTVTPMAIHSWREGGPSSACCSARRSDRALGAALARVDSATG